MSEGLRSGGVYRFGITMRTPFAGHLVVAVTADRGFDLYTLDEWGTLAPPRMHVDAQGRILYHGRTTGYGTEILLDTGESVESVE